MSDFVGEWQTVWTDGASSRVAVTINSDGSGAFTREQGDVKGSLEGTFQGNTYHGRWGQTDGDWGTFKLALTSPMTFDGTWAGHLHGEGTWTGQKELPQM